MSAVRLGGSIVARSAATQAADLIRAAIVDGSLKPGQRLREVELAQVLGLSRTPVREALILLHSDGLVELLANRGARVAVYDRESLTDCYELRALLEGYAARRAATRAEPAQIAALRHSCERFDELRRGRPDVLSLVRENLHFHAVVHEASGSARVPTLVRGLIQVPLLYRAHAWYSPDQRVLSEHHHRDVTAAIEARDSERAEAIMRDHVVEAGTAALRAFDAEAAGAGGRDGSPGSGHGDRARPRL